jgi:hypothetical protein
MANEYASYKTNEISPTLVAFAEWLVEETGYQVDVRSVAMGGGVLRTKFQQSEWWKNDPRNYKANVEANKAKKDVEAAAKAKDVLEKAKKRLADAEAKAKASLAAAKAKADAEAKALADAEGKPEDKAA